MFSHQVARLQSLLKHPLSTPRPGFKILNQVQIFSTACKNGTTSETLKLQVIKSKAPAGPGRRRVCRRDSRAESPPKCLPHAPTCAHAMLRATYLARYSLCGTSDLRIRHKPNSACRSIPRAPIASMSRFQTADLARIAHVGLAEPKSSRPQTAVFCGPGSFLTYLWL